MATVYVHMGMPKTGTTALQYFMWNNNEVLEKYGIHFPHMEYRYSKVGFYRNGHFLIEPKVNKLGKSVYRQPCDDYEPALDELQRLGETYDKIVLSDEGIYRLSWKRPDFWSRLKKDLEDRHLELKAIVYLRRQDLWLQGYWAQKIKEGEVSSFDEFLEDYTDKKQLFDYYAYMSHLAAVLGRDSLVIRIYEKEQFRGAEKNLYSDFLDIFGLTLSDEFEMDKEIRNERFDGAYLEFRRVLNAVPESVVGRKAFQDCIRLSQEEDVKVSEQKFSYFKPHRQKKFLDIYEASNQKVAREFFGREDGRLFYEELHELPEQVVHERELLDATIRVYGRVLDQLLRENKKLKNILQKKANIGTGENAVQSTGVSPDALKILRADMEEQIEALNQELQKFKKEVYQNQEEAGWGRLKSKAKQLLGK